MRPSHRAHNQLREIRLTRNYTKHAEGSVLVEFGDTKVICTASATSGVPPFFKRFWQRLDNRRVWNATTLNTRAYAARSSER